MTSWDKCWTSTGNRAWSNWTPKKARWRCKSQIWTIKPSSGALENLELSRKSAQYARLKAKSDRVQSLYDSLLATLETLDVGKDISPETVAIYEPAGDAIPDQTLAKKGLTIAGAIGLVLGVVMLLLLDRVDDRLNSFTELEELFDEEVLGQIPRERKPPRGGILPFVQADDQRHPFIESYRNLRSSLLYMAQTGTRPHTLLITSSVPNDGKSLTAANLSIMLAMGGARVLLVDADLRKGNLAHRFDIKAEAGLFEVLSQGTDWRSLVKETRPWPIFGCFRAARPRNAPANFSSARSWKNSFRNPTRNMITS